MGFKKEKKNQEGVFEQMYYFIIVYTQKHAKGQFSAKCISNFTRNKVKKKIN